MVEVATSPFGFFPKFSTTVENTVENRREGRFFHRIALISPKELNGETRRWLDFVVNIAGFFQKSLGIADVPVAKVQDCPVFL